MSSVPKISRETGIRSDYSSAFGFKIVSRLRLAIKTDTSLLASVNYDANEENQFCVFSSAFERGEVYLRHLINERWYPACNLTHPHPCPYHRGVFIDCIRSRKGVWTQWRGERPLVLSLSFANSFPLSCIYI